MLIKIVSYIPAIAGILLVGGFVLVNNRRNIKNIAFSTLCFSIALWLLSLFFADTSTNPVFGLWFFRFGLFFGGLMFLCFYFFALVFPFGKKIKLKKEALISLPMLLISALSLTPVIVSRVSIKSFGIQPEDVGALYAATDLIGLVYLFMGIAILLLKYRRSDRNQKNQIKFVLLGLGIAIVVNITTGLVLTLLEVDTNAILFGGFSLFIFTLFVAYTIIRHKFFNIRLVVARTVAYILTIITISILYSLIIFGVVSLLIDSAEPSFGRQLTYPIIAVFLSFTFQPIKGYFDKLSNRLFYRDAYDSQVLLDDLNTILVSTIELGDLMKKCTDLMVNTLRTESCIISIKESEHSSYRTGGANNAQFSENALKRLEEAISAGKNKVIIVDDLQYKDPLKNLLSHLNVALVSVLTDASKTTLSSSGFIFFGQKRNGSSFTRQDIKVIELISDEMLIATQNAIRFEEIQNFATTMQTEVEIATRKLKINNLKLQALDEAKDEFISMASHQLRTPLTSIKGYLSLVLEGDAGNIQSKQREMLSQAFTSSQRMVYLISDLLNVSRLRTGKFIIEPKPTYLPNVISEELNQVIETAKARKVAIEYDKPKDFPTVNLDDTKIRQVIMNFVDNAIYYTRAGGTVKVVLSHSPKNIEFLVVDNGIGVPKSEQHKLFTKFYRAGNAREARPDGTGLGLFMAKKVIVASGGALIFKTQEGKGSTFGFTFPLEAMREPKKLSD